MTMMVSRDQQDCMITCETLLLPLQPTEPESTHYTHTSHKVKRHTTSYASQCKTLGATFPGHKESRITYQIWREKWIVRKLLVQVVQFTSCRVRGEGVQSNSTVLVV